MAEIRKIIEDVIAEKAKHSPSTALWEFAVAFIAISIVEVVDLIKKKIEEDKG